MGNKFRACYLAAVLLTVLSSSLFAEPAQKKARPRRQFITVFVNRMYTGPLNFEKHPLEELAGTGLEYVYQPVPEVYRSPDGLTTITHTRFRPKNSGGGLAVYPFGLGVQGTSLMLQADYETLPLIGFIINSPTGREDYEFANGRAYNLGLGAVSYSRSYNGNMGSRSYIIGGTGKIIENRGEGRSYFVGFGGGLSYKIIGGEFFVKVSRNYLNNPRPHSFYLIPIGFRISVTF